MRVSGEADRGVDEEAAGRREKTDTRSRVKDVVGLVGLLGRSVPERRTGAPRLRLVPVAPGPVVWNTLHAADNLEVLPRLEPGSVDVVYTDPPYNTGNDFAYADRFRDGCRPFGIRRDQLLKPRRFLRRAFAIQPLMDQPFIMLTSSTAMVPRLRK